MEPDGGQEFRDYIDLAHPARLAKTAKTAKTVFRAGRSVGRRLGRVISGDPPNAADGSTACLKR